jgi:hypothetical protein
MAVLFNSYVILSAAKDLVHACAATEILRCAQDDMRRGRQ